jgi:hypothetical protein
MTGDQGFWWGLAGVGAAMIAAFVTILLIVWLGRQVNHRRRPPV